MLTTQEAMFCPTAGLVWRPRNVLDHKVLPHNPVYSQRPIDQLNFGLRNTPSRGRTCYVDERAIPRRPNMKCFSNPRLKDEREVESCYKFTKVFICGISYLLGLSIFTNANVKGDISEKLKIIVHFYQSDWYNFFLKVLGWYIQGVR